MDCLDWKSDVLSLRGQVADNRKPGISIMLPYRVRVAIAVNKQTSTLDSISLGSHGPCYRTHLVGSR